MLKCFLGLFFCMPAIIGAAKIPNYSPDSLIVKFDKSGKGYVSYQIPEAEKAFTKEIREVHLLGRVFADSDKIKIFPSQIPAPKSPFEAVSNFLFVANSGDKGKLSALHDISSRHWVDSTFRDSEESASFFNFWKDVKSIEIKAVFETPDLIIVFHKNVKGDASFTRMLFFVRSNGIYQKKSGTIDVGFLQNLQGALQHADPTVIFKK